jgi:hypothetical protein
MRTYLFVHHFPRGFQGSPETAAAAQAWFAQLEPNLAGRTDRAFEPRRLGDCGGEPEPAAYELITSEEPDAAMALAAAWPLLRRGGGIEVWELIAEKIRLPASAEAR